MQSSILGSNKDIHGVHIKKYNFQQYFSYIVCPKPDVSMNEFHILKENKVFKLCF